MRAANSPDFAPLFHGPRQGFGHEGWQTQIQRYTPTLKLLPRRPLSRRPDYTLRSPCFCAYPHTGKSHSRLVSEPFPLPGHHWIAATEGYRKPCAVGNGSQPIRSRARGCLARRDLAADCPLFPASWKLVAISFEFLPSDERYLVCCTWRFPAGRGIEGS